MIATTTSSSISVNPRARLGRTVVAGPAATREFAIFFSR
jgi:hypothetical protein